MISILNAAEAVLAPALDAGHGDDPALLADGRLVRYAELARAVNRAGNALVALGIGRGDRVLFLLRDTPGFIAAYLATMKIGAIAVALNTRSPGEALAHVLDDSGARLLLVDVSLLKLLDQVPAAARNGVTIAAVGGAPPGTVSWDAAEAGASESLTPAPTPALDPALLIN